MDSKVRAAAARELQAAQELYEAARRVISSGKPLSSDAPVPSAIAFEAVMTAIEYALPCPDWAARETVACWHRFQYFEVETISEAFGIPEHSHRAAKRSRLLVAAIARRVYALSESGTPLRDNTSTRGAWSIVGEEFNISPRTVELRVRQWEELCSELGSDPRAKPVYGDALDASAWRRGWAGDFGSES